jgi:tRNA(adenine34) deaminase
MQQTDEQLMQRAIDAGRAALRQGDEPYGAVVVRGDAVVEGCNRIHSAVDPTAHAETEAIRNAAREWGTIDLSGAMLYASFEPCPMCVGAMLASGITRVFISRRRALGAPPHGPYTVEQLLALTGRTDITVESGLLREATVEMMTPFQT